MTLMMRTGSSMKSLRGFTMRSGCPVSAGLQAAGPSLECLSEVATQWSATLRLAAICVDGKLAFAALVNAGLGLQQGASMLSGVTSIKRAAPDKWSLVYAV